jgi:hypothetical protein
METTKKKRAPEGAQTQPPAQAVEPAAIREERLAERRRRLDSYRDKWRDTRSVAKQLGQLHERDGLCIMALLDLFEFDAQCSQESENWLGEFIFDLLMEVAAEGVLSLANEPEAVSKMLQDVLDRLLPDLEMARDFVARYPKLVARLPVTAVGGGSEVEPCQ